jgi:hypothetical protein
MASFLTALANIGSQYGQAKVAAGEEMARRQQQQTEQQMALARLGQEQAQQKLQQQRLEFEQQQAKRPLTYSINKQDYVWLPDKGRIATPEEMKAMGIEDARGQARAALQGFADTNLTGDYAKEAAGILTIARQIGEEPAKTEDRLIAVKKAQDAAQAKKQIGLKTSTIAPELLAQHPVPNPDDYAQGTDDPLFKEAYAKWGADIQKAKEAEASAAGVERAKAWGANRYGSFITPGGQMVSGTWGDAVKNGWVEARTGENALQTVNRIQEIQYSSGQLRDAINALQPGDAFTAASTTQLNAALHLMDMGIVGKVPIAPGAVQEMLQNAAAASLNERQQEYLTWMAQTAESAMALSRIGGMGRAAQDMRDAIRATLPGINAGSKAFALRKLDAFDAEVRNLGRVPQLPFNVPPVQPPTAPGSTTGPPAPPGQSLDKTLDRLFGPKPGAPAEVDPRTGRPLPPLPKPPVAPAGVP